jgi:hypothetical protein
MDGGGVLSWDDLGRSALRRLVLMTKDQTPALGLYLVRWRAAGSYSRRLASSATRNRASLLVGGLFRSGPSHSESWRRPSKIAETRIASRRLP